jgi:hypothetical protein
MTYRLVVTLDEAQVQAWDSIELAAGEQWEVRFTIPVRQNVDSAVNALLYRVDRPDEIYRSVSLTLEQ